MPQKENSNNQIENQSQKSLSLVFVVLACLVAGFVGAAAYGWVSAKLPNSRIANTQSKNVVVSEQNATIDIAKKVGPSVVSITSSSSGQDVFGRATQQQAAGTGIVLSANGLILTNKHVVEGGSAFVVTTSDQKQYKDAKVVATDPSNDIAFIKVDASGLKPAELGDSSKVEIGSFVVAIGNALGEFQNTVTTGVISGKGRPVTAASGDSAEKLQNLFQTDAAINPGNSGGPLVNIDGQVIGINTAVAGQGSENIGFAIPINEAKRDIETVEKGQQIKRAYLGVAYVMLNSELAQENNIKVNKGAYITNTCANQNSHAHSAGLKTGDVIIKIDNTELTEDYNLSSVIASYNPGDTVTVTFVRDGKEQTVKVKLGQKT